MPSPSGARPESLRKVHYSDGHVRRLTAAGVLAALGLVALFVIARFMIRNVTASAAGGVLAAALLTAGISCYIDDRFFRSRIVTSPHGLQYRGIGYNLETTWDNLDRIDRADLFQEHATWRGGAFTGYHLHCDRVVFRRPATIQAHHQGERGHEEKPEIFLNEFADWESGMLGQELRQYAPHLFAQGSPQSS